MSDVMRLRLVSVVAVLSITILGVGGCKIKYDSEKGADGAFNAKTYVEELWDSKAIPLMHTAPIDVGTVLTAIAKDPEAAGEEYGHRPGEGQPWSYLVKGEGAITSVDVASRHGTATLEVDDRQQADESHPSNRAGHLRHRAERRSAIHRLRRFRQPNRLRRGVARR